MRRGEDLVLVVLFAFVAFTAGLVFGYVLATSDARADAASVEVRR